MSDKNKSAPVQPAERQDNNLSDLPDTLPVNTEIVDPSHGIKAFWTSLPAATAAEKGRVYNLLHRENREMSEILNISFRLEHLIVETSEKLNKDTGEVTTRRSVYLISSDGVCAAGSSGGVWRSLQQLVQLFGAPPWPPLMVTLRQKTIDNSWRYYYLELDEDQFAPPKSSTRKGG